MPLRHYRPPITFLLSALFLLIGFCLYYVRLANTTGTIVVHFLAGQGADILGEPKNALNMLIFGTGMAGVNLTLAATLWRRNRPLSQVTGIVTTLVSLLILIAICGIINVN